MTKFIDAEDVLAYAFLTRARQIKDGHWSANESNAVARPEEGLRLVLAFSSLVNQNLRLAAVKFVADLARLERSASQDSV